MPSSSLVEVDVGVEVGVEVGLRLSFSTQFILLQVGGWLGGRRKED